MGGRKQWNSSIEEKRGEIQRRFDSLFEEKKDCSRHFMSWDVAP